MNLLALRGRDRAFLREILTEAATIEPSDALASKSVGTLFFENSTRTRSSFIIAARRLGAEVVDLSSVGSSMNKGESLIDTAQTIEAMGVEVLVVRTSAPRGAHLIADHVACSVVNAGDGGHEHPTQGLLDALSIGEATGRTDWNFEGLRVLIVGDVVHSRVARSNIACLTTLGAHVTLVGPPLLVPRSMETLGCSVSHDLDALAPEADAIMTLRVQYERGATLASAREYCEHYALTRERAARTNAYFMHPGPMNRGLEIDEDVAKSERSLILQQVANGVRVRMAVLRRAAG